MKLNLDRLERALDELKKNPSPRVETADDWADEWFYGLAKKYGCDPWEVWDGEADELERKSIEENVR